MFYLPMYTFNIASRLYRVGIYIRDYTLIIKNQIYDTLVRHGCIFKLVPHDGIKILIVKSRKTLWIVHNILQNCYEPKWDL